MQACFARYRNSWEIRLAGNVIEPERLATFQYSSWQPRALGECSCSRFIYEFICRDAWQMPHLNAVQVPVALLQFPRRPDIPPESLANALENAWRCIHQRRRLRENARHNILGQQSIFIRLHLGDIATGCVEEFTFGVCCCGPEDPSITAVFGPNAIAEAQRLLALEDFSSLLCSGFAIVRMDQFEPGLY